MAERRLAWQPIVAGACLALLAASAAAEVVTDGTVGTRGRVTLSGPDVRVTPDLGTQRGANLFHSFQRFGVPAGSSVTFEGPAGIANVIGRVTGGTASQIDGRLASTMPGAALFLINPSGIVVGRTATIDVPGSLHLSTADELRFQDGKAFSATDPQASTLTSAAPSSFGFLGGKVGKLSVQAPRLALPLLAGLSLVAGEVQIDGTQAQIVGPVLLAAQTGAGDVAITTEQAAVPREGLVRIANGASLSVLLPGGQAVRVEAGRFVLDQSSIGVLSVTPAGTPAADRTGLVVAARGIELKGSAAAPAIIGGIGIEGGQGPIIGLLAGRISLDGGYVYSVGTGTQSGGRIAVLANDLRLDHGSFIGSPSGVAGGFEVSGAGGQTVVYVANDLTITGDSSIVSGTTTSEAAGDVEVRARTVTLDDGFITVGNEQGSGRPGRVAVTARDGLTMRNGSAIAAFTTSASNGGTVGVFTDRLVMESGATIVTDTTNAGDSGTIIIAAGSVDLSETSTIQASSGGTGRAGDIVMTVGGDLRLDGAGIETGSARSSGGLLLLGIDGRLILQNGAQVATTILGSDPNQRAGAISISDRRGTGASRAVVVDAYSRIVSNAPNVGNGGTIVIRTDALVAPIGGISASARQGNSGIVSTNTPETDITSSFAGLGTEIDPNRQVLATSCDARAITSSLTVGAVQTTERRPARHGAGCKAP